MKIGIQSFKGISPKTNPRYLTDGAAQTALNVEALGQSLKPLPGLSAAVATLTNATGTVSTVYRYRNDGTPCWLNWTGDVDVAPAQITDDEVDWVFFTDGTAYPRATNNTIACEDGNTNNPDTAYRLGLPAPETTPMAEVRKYEPKQFPAKVYVWEEQLDELAARYGVWVSYDAPSTAVKVEYNPSVEDEADQEEYKVLGEPDDDGRTWRVIDIPVTSDEMTLNDLFTALANDPTINNGDLNDTVLTQEKAIVYTEDEAVKLVTVAKGENTNLALKMAKLKSYIFTDSGTKLSQLPTPASVTVGLMYEVREDTYSLAVSYIRWAVSPGGYTDQLSVQMYAVDLGNLVTNVVAALNAKPGISAEHIGIDTASYGTIRIYTEATGPDVTLTVTTDQETFTSNGGGVNSDERCLVVLPPEYLRRVVPDVGVDYCVDPINDDSHPRFTRRRPAGIWSTVKPRSNSPSDIAAALNAQLNVSAWVSDKDGVADAEGKHVAVESDAAWSVNKYFISVNILEPSSVMQRSSEGYEQDMGTAESRAYAWTWLSDQDGLVQESAPSAPSKLVEVYAGGTTRVYGLDAATGTPVQGQADDDPFYITGTTDALVTGRRLYRTVAGTYLFVDEIPMNGTRPLLTLTAADLAKLNVGMDDEYVSEISLKTDGKVRAFYYALTENTVPVTADWNLVLLDSPAVTDELTHYEFANQITANSELIAVPDEANGSPIVKVYGPEFGATKRLTLKLFTAPGATPWTDVRYAVGAATGTQITEYIDALPAIRLGEVMPSTTWTAPPAGLTGLINMPGGMMAAFKGRDLWFCVPYRPYAWPEDYRRTLDYPIVGLGRMDTTLAVLTTGAPYFVQGADPGFMTVVKSDLEQACLSKRSIVSVGGAVIYASPDGLMMLSPGGSKILTEQQFSRAQWQAFKPESIHAYTHDMQYFGFYDTGTVAGGFIYDLRSGQFNLHTTSVNGGYSDLETDTLYLVGKPSTTNLIYTWGGGSGMTGTWKSKKFSLPQVGWFSCAQLEAEAYTTPITFKLYGDGSLVHTRAVSSRQPFRLPVVPARDWEIEIVTTHEVFNVVIAQSMEELASA